MFESEIKAYVERLRRELTVQGLSQQRVDDIATETEAHLVEMVEDAQPKSLIAYRQIEAKFGPERTMAKTIAAEYDRSASSRKRLWPLAFSILAIGLMWAPTPLSQWAGSYQFWSHIFWTLTTAGFIVLGFLARKPSLGQFAALAAGWIVVGTAWAATTCYPVVDSPREEAVATGLFWTVYFMKRV